MRTVWTSLNLNFIYPPVLSSPEHEALNVSYCDRSMSVVRRPSFVMRRQQFASKDYSSHAPGTIDLKLGRKYRSDW